MSFFVPRTVGVLSSMPSMENCWRASCTRSSGRGPNRT
jgi:hypothetical protein